MSSALVQIDMLLIKYNSSGSKQRSQQLGTTGDESGRGVAVMMMGIHKATEWLLN